MGFPFGYYPEVFLSRHVKQRDRRSVHVFIGAACLIAVDYLFFSM